jgi:ribonuclease HII
VSRARTIAEIRALLADARGKRLARLLEELADDDRLGVRSACDAASSRQAAARRETERTRKLYDLEHSLQAQGFTLVAGVDEVGRGALAGPLTVAAVILPTRPHIEGLDDSKRLTPRRREELAHTIHAGAVAVSIAHVPAEEIDALGVTAALKRAILSALSGLSCGPDHVVIDGLPLRVVERETAVVKGDSKVAAIAAASIVAKVARDQLMREYALVHPEFGFEINKGYGTAEHIEAITRLGPTVLHRRSFSAGGGTMSLF